jgi:hypothetical protein
MMRRDSQLRRQLSLNLLMVHHRIGRSHYLLTPPATNDLQSTSNPQSPVSAVLDLIKQRQCHKSTSQSRQLKVKPLEYKILLARLEGHMHVDGAHKSTLELFKPECYSYPLTAANNESTRPLFALPRSTTSCI